MTTNVVRQFTHGDLDGVACAIVARSLFSAAHLAVPCQYSGPDEVNDRINKYLDGVVSGVTKTDNVMLLITDICPSLDTCVRIEALAPEFDRVVLFDHHGTSAWAKKFSWVVHNTDCCAAKLLFESAVSTDGDLRNLVNAANARDMWLRDSPYWERGERLTLLYKFIGFESFLSSFTKNLNADSSGWLSEIGNTLLERYKSLVQRTIDRFIPDSSAFMKDRMGLKYALLIAGEEVSEMGHTALQQFPELDYVVMALPTLGIISLRSRKGGVDVAIIAKRNGGGGHPPAAGFPLDMMPAIRTLLDMRLA